MGSLQSRKEKDEKEQMYKKFTFKCIIDFIRNAKDYPSFVLIDLFNTKFKLNKTYEGWNMIELTHFMRVALMYKPNSEIIQTLIEKGIHLFEVDVNKIIVPDINDFLNFKISSSELTGVFIKEYSYKIFDEFNIWSIQNPLIKPVRK
jgi:hypothetical protein